MTVRIDRFDRTEVDNLVSYGNRSRRKPYEIGISELVEATRRLAGLGYVDGQIAAHLATTRRQVQRWRTYGKIPPAIPQNFTSLLIRTDLPNLPSETKRRGRERVTA